MEGIQNNDVATLALLGGGNGVGTGWGRGHRFDYDGSVINAKQEASAEAAAVQTDRIINTQELIAQAAVAAELNDKFATIALAGAVQANQIDRRFADQDAKAAECCCALKAGQAEIKAMIDAQNLVANAVTTAVNGAKLDQILSSGGRHG